MTPRQELVLELGLTESHGLALEYAIPAFAERLAVLLAEHTIPHGAIWSGGSNRRVSAVVGVSSSTPAELWPKLLPALLEGTFKPQTPLRISVPKVNLVSRIHSLTARLGAALIPVRLGTLLAVPTARGVNDGQRIAWSAEDGYLTALRAAGVELDVCERVRAAQHELRRLVTLEWAPFEPASEVIEAWALEGEQVCCERQVHACDFAELPKELLAELAVKHRSVPLAFDAESGTFRVLEVAPSSATLTAAALADECQRASALFVEALSTEPGRAGLSDAQAPPLAARFDEVAQVCEMLAARLNLSTTVLELSLRAAPYLNRGRATALVSAFPRLLGVVCCAIAEREGAAKLTLEVLRAQQREPFGGPASPPLQAAALLSLAENLSVLMTAAATGALPAGPIDPHLARVRAVFVLKTLIAREWDLRVTDMVRAVASIRGLKSGVGVLGAEERLVGFLRHRMRGLLDEATDRPGALGFDAELDSPLHRARYLQNPK